jgi:hypothetical protein
MMKSDQVVDRLAILLMDMEEYKRVGDRVNASRQVIVQGLRLQAGECRRYVVGGILVEVACDDKGEYTFRPAPIEG